jgi:hypothetical protein
MKRVNLIGVALGAMIVACAVLPGAAPALQWLLNHKGLATKVSVSSSGLLIFSDLAATGGALTVECESTDKGTVGPSEHDEITEIKTEGCEFESGKNGACEAEAEVTAAALNLPWLSLLLTVSETAVDKLTAPGGKNVGWSVSCKVAGVLKVEDGCTSSASEANVFDLAVGVELFSEESAPYSCTDGNRTSGMIVGPDLVESPRGETLSVQCPELCEDGEWLSMLNTGGEAKEEKGAICVFLRVDARCSVQSTNDTRDNATIIGGRFLGSPSRDNYRVARVGCMGGAALDAGRSCTDEIEITRFVADTMTKYCVLLLINREGRVACHELLT